MSTTERRPEFINLGTPRWFVYVLVALLCALAVLFWQFTQNGRYELSREGTAVLDTRTGELCGSSSVGVTCVNVVKQGRRR